MAEQNYLDRFQTFVSDPKAPLRINFEQLAISKGWRPNGRTYKKERKAYIKALAETHIGSIERGGAAERLVGLQELCEKLGVSPIPASITQCKKELQSIHVCIIDLIDGQRLGKKVKVFPSYRALQHHVTTEVHFFPKDEAKERSGGILRILLRRMYD